MCEWFSNQGAPSPRPQGTTERELFSDRCLSPSGHHLIRGTGAWHFQRWHRGPSQPPGDSGGCRSRRFEEPSGSASCGAAENVIGERRNFEQDVDRREKSNKEDREPSNELDRGKRAGGGKLEGADHEAPGGGDQVRRGPLKRGVLE